MRFASLLTNSVTLFVLQQVICLWFLTDFFLARDSTTANRLFNDQLSRKTTSQVRLQVNDISDNLIASICNQDPHRTSPTFDKVVLIVIDAFGAEFLPSLRDERSQDVQVKMPFLEGAMRRNEAMGFIAKAATPTVTMPRIKSLVSGNIPSFMDIVYNLASDVSQFHDDNILQQAKSRGKSLVFYGDDTWLSLYDRSMFKRARETLSLFASDYTSVDTNVTEMALPETKRDPLDWDYLILHYLGLDHIGHVFGSNEGPLINKKLVQMDNVLSEIYSDLSKKSEKTLIIVCGDHGMSREGNHGGDTQLETETAMIFLPINSGFNLQGISNQLDRRILQVDLAATISVLMGMPIPTMSRGVVIEHLLESLWVDDGIKSSCTIVSNLVQLVRLLDDVELEKPNGLGSKVLELLKQSTSSGAESSNRIKFNRFRTRQYYELARDIQSHLLRIATAKSKPLLVMTALLFVMFLSFRNLYRASIRLLLPLMTKVQKTLCLGTVLVPILMQGSTDYIETENRWWVAFSLFVTIGFLSNAIYLHHSHSIGHDLEMLRFIQFIICFTFVALWNNANISSDFELGWSLPVISVLIMCTHSRSTSKLDQRSSFLIFHLIGLCVFVTKMVEETSEKEVNQVNRIAWMQLFSSLFLTTATVVNLFITIREEGAHPTALIQKLAASWMWLIFMLSRSRNYPFLISNVMMEASLNSISNSFKLNPISRALIYLTLSSMAFFSQGNSNLFSSLDVKPAFFAQTSYHIWLAVPLVACSTFGTQIYWYIKLFQRVQGEKEQERMAQSVSTTKRQGPMIAPTPSNSSHVQLIPEGTKDAIKDFIDMRNFLMIGYFMFVCIILRNHLFIWSVISPKLVYLFVTNTILCLTTFTISILPKLLVKLSDLYRPGGTVKYQRINT